jgi:hypothetical protein
MDGRLALQVTKMFGLTCSAFRYFRVTLPGDGDGQSFAFMYSVEVLCPIFGCFYLKIVRHFTNQSLGTIREVGDKKHWSVCFTKGINAGKPYPKNK